MGDCCEETCNEEYGFYPCGANQPYSCDDPLAGQTISNPTGSAITQETRSMDPRDSSFYFHDGFEANVFDPLHWKWMGGDASWDIEREVSAAEGLRYAEAQTAFIVNDMGTAELELTIESPQGGTLSYKIQTSVQAPFDDVLVEVDGAAVEIVTDALSDWTALVLQVEPGRVVVRWSHRKNPSDASPEEFAGMSNNLGITRIDDVTFLPN